MTLIMFTVADVKMANFARTRLWAHERRQRLIDIMTLDSLAKDGWRYPLEQKLPPEIGAGATYLRRTASGAVSVVRNNPGKTAGAAGALALTAAGATYLLNKRKKKGKQDYSRQIRTVYFSRRHN